MRSHRSASTPTGPNSSMSSRALVEEAEAVRQLVVVRSGQRVFSEVIEAYLNRIEYGRDGYTKIIRLPAYRRRRSSRDPTRGFGQPIFSHGGVRVSDVLDRFWSGDDINTLSSEFGVQEHEIEDPACRIPTGCLTSSLTGVARPNHGSTVATASSAFDFVTLAERYGIPDDERVTDEQWLAEAGQLGEVVLMKDESRALQRSREAGRPKVRSSVLLPD